MHVSLLFIINLMFSGGDIRACAEGYTDILCTKCIGFNEENTQYYASTGLGSCALCTSLGSQVVILLLLLFALVLYVAFIVV
jgi:hypothetical protein